MILAVRTARLDTVKHQLLSLLKLRAEDISAVPTNYSGITLLDLDEKNVSVLRSIRNIEVLLVDEATAAELQHPTKASEKPSFKSLNGLFALEQYENLNQILHLRKAVRDKR